MKRILQVDGGGIMGIIPAVFLAGLEARLLEKGITTPLYELFDLMSGSSTGAVLTAALASGLTAEQASKIYTEEGVALFADAVHRNWRFRRPWRGKYRRKDFVEEFRRHLSKGTLADLHCRIMITAVSIVDFRTHYLKSDDTRRPSRGGPADAEIRVIDAVARSGLSAPYYFNPVDDPAGKQVWIDGGSFTENCSAEECMIEAVDRDWHEEGVRLLSLGTGHEDPSRPYDKAAKVESWRVVRDYVNEARQRCVPRQFERIDRGLAKLAPTLQYHRVDIEVPASINALDGAEHAKTYEELGRQLVEGQAEAVEAFLEVQ